MNDYTSVNYLISGAIPASLYLIGLWKALSSPLIQDPPRKYNGRNEPQISRILKKTQKIKPQKPWYEKEQERNQIPVIKRTPIIPVICYKCYHTTPRCRKAIHCPVCGTKWKTQERTQN